MKQLLRKSIDAGLARLRASGDLADDAAADYQIGTPKHEAHGDYSSNVAMLLAGVCRRPPRDIAKQLTDVLADDPIFEKVEVAGPGFINFVIGNERLYRVVDDVLAAGPAYGSNETGQGQKIQVEFVSANPTGPLHIGHGRGAAIGSVIARLLGACGYDVSSEYYVNDAGRQMDILALSVYLRYLESYAIPAEFPVDAYRGEYIRTIAAAFKAAHGDSFRVDALARYSGVDIDDPERALDAGTAAMIEALGEARYLELRSFATAIILDEIQADLEAFGVHFDVWYSEASLAGRGLIDAAIERLDASGHLYRREGARWFRSIALGDEKDRVVVRENGHKTYFASDIAYHLDKFNRGFDRVVNVWGADHHGYVPRVKAALSALGRDPNDLDIVLVQFAALVRGGEKVAMSTRSGEFVTLRELVDEVGVDAARFFYVMRRADQHLEFDLDLATSRNNENPVYYVQYAHARICSVFKQLAERGFEPPPGDVALAPALDLPAERKIAMMLMSYPEMIAAAAQLREPHGVTQYLRDLAHEFHAYYNAQKIIVEQRGVRDARLRLIGAVRQVLSNGLDILGVSAPQEM